jgi:indolepyruvate ferredoxin oxidoreductase beta subunit
MAVADARGRRPVMALTPGIGDIDLMVASELVEAGRAVAAGFVTPDRTLMIASTHRFYAMDEKIQMGDGRVDSRRLIEGIGEMAQRSVLLDMADLARQSGAMINAVMLGAIAGSGRLPIPPDAFEAAIRRDGKAVDSNVRGFRAGLAAVRDGVAAPRRRPDGKRPHGETASLAGLEQEIRATMPPAAADMMVEGVRRLQTYQDLAYARLYVDRLGAIREADRRAGAEARLLRETARHLAVRMSFEDVIRVAQAKIAPARFSRIVTDMKIGPAEPFRVVEFLKPGIEEFCSILPPRLARKILPWAERRGLIGHVHWGMEIATTSVSGYLRFRLLAGLRKFRPKSYRFQEEQAAITGWLALITQAAAISADLALEIADCARLIKGYGDTHRQGTANYRLIESRIIHPALAGAIRAHTAVDAIASARTAALLDPEGERLSLALQPFPAELNRI